ncbi:MAG: hypothetical protein L0Y72_27140 [Gemmataceae bacterium]|nr:hypothetical protein [Gemmataceae bacterium]MCI0742727.1 hypothetical protein [Gemmataceae bacterium]
MGATTPAPQPRDEWKERLQNELKKGRPRRWRIAFVVLALAAAVAALVLWLMSPGAEPPRLAMVAFDQLSPRGAEVELQARLELAEPGTRRLQGLDIHFLDGKIVVTPKEDPKKVTVQSGPGGEASCPWTFPAAAKSAEFVARHVGDKHRPPAEDRALVYMPPPAAPMCLVQIEETLTQAGEENWRKDNLLDIQAVSDAGGVLQALKKKGFQIVYLALGAERPLAYQKMRGWIRHQQTQPAGFPPGPVLGRFAPLKDQGGKVWQTAAERVKEQFPEDKARPHIAIAGSIDVAQQLHAAGIGVYYLGEGRDLPADVRRAPNWAELRLLLER